MPSRYLWRWQELHLPRCTFLSLCLERSTPARPGGFQTSYLPWFYWSIECRLLLVIWTPNISSVIIPIRVLLPTAFTLWSISLLLVLLILLMLLAVVWSVIPVKTRRWANVVPGNAKVLIHHLHSRARPCNARWSDAPAKEVIVIDSRHHSSDVGKAEVLPFLRDYRNCCNKACYRISSYCRSMGPSGGQLALRRSGQLSIMSKKPSWLWSGIIFMWFIS